MRRKNSNKTPEMMCRIDQVGSLVSASMPAGKIGAAIGKEIIDRIQRDGRMAQLAIEMYVILRGHEKDLNSLQYNDLVTELQDWKLTMDDEMR